MALCRPYNDSIMSSQGIRLFAKTNLSVKINIFVMAHFNFLLLLQIYSCFLPLHLHLRQFQKTGYDCISNNSWMRKSISVSMPSLNKDN